MSALSPTIEPPEREIAAWRAERRRMQGSWWNDFDDALEQLDQPQISRSETTTTALPAPQVVVDSGLDAATPPASSGRGDSHARYHLQRPLHTGLPARRLEEPVVRAEREFRFCFMLGADEPPEDLTYWERWLLGRVETMSLQEPPRER